MALTNTVQSATYPAVLGKDIHDIKPLIAIPSGWEWVWWGMAALLVVGAVVALILYLKRRRENIVPTPPVPAHVLARQRLEQALALIRQPKPFCTEVSDTIRQYLEGRFNFHAPDRTTDEFLYELRDTNLLTSDQKDGLGAFLQQCDMVKFAKYEPDESSLRGLHESALRLVEETEPPVVTAGAVERVHTPSPLPVSQT